MPTLKGDDYCQSRGGNSLSAIQESYSLLVQVDQLLESIEARINSIEMKSPRIERALGSFRDAERIALRFLAIPRKMGLPENIDRMIERIAQLVVVLRMAQIAMGQLALGTLAGALTGGAGFFLVALTGYSNVMMQIGE
jgi:hypothetical protein